MPRPDTPDRTAGRRAWILGTVAASLWLPACETEHTVTQLGSPPYEEWVATLSVDLDGQQVQPSGQDTGASGQATLTFMRQISGFLGGTIIMHKLHFEITAQGIDSVISAHLHGPSETDTIGPILAVLFDSPAGTGAVNGQLIGDSIPHAYGFEFEDDRVPDGMSVEGILGLTMQELVYVDVHTRAYPDGEIRGNVR